MARVTDEDRRRAEEFVATLRFRGKPLTELPDSAAQIIAGVAKEFSSLRSQAYFRGLRDGVQRFAWWKDGVQHVGTTGRTLRQALDEVATQESEARVG